MSNNDIFVVIGTPLPQPKKQHLSGDNKRANPAKDLERVTFFLQVKDEQGRRRFHGAFTGGFSAGYYNTVGSAEGLDQVLHIKYTPPSDGHPQTSSPPGTVDPASRPQGQKTSWTMKINRQGHHMLSDATRLMATDDFGTSGSAQRDLARKSAAAMSMRASGSILGALSDNMIDDLIIPASESIGVRLLKRMGWKPGQGIGPRVSKRQRHPTGDPLSDDDTPAHVTFAPIDSALILFTNKSNHFGLGFDPHKDAPEFDVSAHAKTGSRYLAAAVSTSTGARLGFGVLGESEDDEDGVYGSGSNRRHFTEREVDITVTSNKRRKSAVNSTQASSRSTSSSAYCSDGRPPLAGFVLIATKSQAPKWYTAPDVPSDFIPQHTFYDDGKKMAPVKQHGQSKLTADDRALVLGETPINAPRRSVFEYISAENKNRLDGMLGFVLDVDGEKHMRKDHWEVPKMEKSAAEAALQGFIPFSDNVSKQQRYKQYLNVQAGLSTETIEKVEGFSGQDMTKELNEFVQAARIFKPLSTSMSSRFTSASRVFEIQQPAPGLRSAADIQSTPAEKSAPVQRVMERMEIPKSQAAKAAEMGMFGPLTRSTVDFFPNKLLCKRFNVPDPHPEHKDVGPEAAKDLLDKATMDSMMMEGIPAGSLLSKEGSMGTESGAQLTADLADKGPGAEAEQELVEPIQERPPMDIFKAIFDDSDSDSDSDTGRDAEADAEADSTAANNVSNPLLEATAMGQSIEAENEGASSVPFRPMFTRRTNRGARSPSLPSNSPSQTPKIGFRHVDGRVREDKPDIESDDDQIGPKLDLSERGTTTRRQKSRNPAPSDNDPRRHPIKDGEDTPGHPTPVSSTYNRDSDSEDFIGPPAPPTLATQSTLPVANDLVPDGQGQMEAESCEQETRRESRSTKRHESSASRMEEDERSRSKRSRSERASRSSRSHRRSPSSERTSKSRRHGVEDEDNERVSYDNDEHYRKARSGESSSKRTRMADDHSRDRQPTNSHRERGTRDRDSTTHRKEHRSRPNDKNKESDHERDHSRSSSSRRHRHSRSEKGSSRQSGHDREHKRTRGQSDDRHTNAREDEDDSDDFWVEKESDSASAAKGSGMTDTVDPPQTALPSRSRPRAAAFF
ncbi:hypothetical protein BGZ95_002385 [Linnemannia exigua]|uniref:G-patch domain-containing protein n=1 Tax=Linnemannia exigua TaxID=604196 RepID=A0AAD4D5M2_9FUNG|nr:hypothetical protein BGZ95_002385 [Linnemannia exigua]